MWDLDASISIMNSEELFTYLSETLKFPVTDMEEHKKRNVDGEAFSNLSRDDFAVIFPTPEKFILASKLHRLAKQSRVLTSSIDAEEENTDVLLADLEDVASIISSTHSIRSASMSSASGKSRSASPKVQSTPRKRAMGTDSSNSKLVKKHKDTCVGSSSSEFKLPVFSPDVRKCIRNDAFYTSTQRNKLIKEACSALRGYCWELDKPISNDEKKNLAKMLCEMAPKSLGDPGNENKPEAGIYGQIVKWFQNHSYLDRKACEVRSKW